MGRRRRRIKDVRRRPRNSTARDPGHVIHHRKRSKIRNTITSARLRLQNWFGEILPPQIAAALSIDPRF
jgi:hypothetical protein